MCIQPTRQQKLADEVVESQKTRSDFLRWKLILCAALGAAGLGITSGSSSTSLIGLLALIPLTCAYVDLLCSNINLRIILIGKYFAKEQDPYESFVGKHRVVFSLEDWALYGSTYVISAILILLAMVYLFLAAVGEQGCPKPTLLVYFEYLGIILSSVIGIVLTRWTQLAYTILNKADPDVTTDKFLNTLCGQTWLFRFFLCFLKKLKERKPVLIIHNETLLGFLRHSYLAREIDHLAAFLETAGTFFFHRLDNGLFPAVASAADLDPSGYQYVWVRDNVHIAYAHYVWGETYVAVRTVNALMSFFQTQRHRMQQIIEDPSLAADPMNRPHVRFDGAHMKELNQRWPHAQNDALGYFLWLYCRLAKGHLVPFGESEKACLADLVLYFKAIEYWQDQDSGHWEETRKVSASSIGAVVAGLREYSALRRHFALQTKSALSASAVDEDNLAGLLLQGEEALRKILPYECPEGEGKRRYDAALLFLIYPLQVVSSEVASQILADVRANLEGEIGIRRYLNDSYWCPDYRSLFPADERTGDFSENMKKRDAHIRPGEEAQWCIFDPIISCIYGIRVLEGQGGARERALQTHYLNRALGQLTDGKGGMKPLQCPEAYFLEAGRYIPNEHTPLQWTQANLKMALHLLRVTVGGKKSLSGQRCCGRKFGEKRWTPLSRKF